MFKPKNQVTVTITDCCHCPNATLKFEPEEEEDFMYCQTVRSCIQLRKGWGNLSLPDWCPRLNHMTSVLREYHRKQIENPGIVS